MAFLTGRDGMVAMYDKNWDNGPGKPKGRHYRALPVDAKEHVKFGCGEIAPESEAPHVPEAHQVDFKKYSKDQLIDLAEEAGIEGAAKMKVAEIIAELERLKFVPAASPG